MYLKNIFLILQTDGPRVSEAGALEAVPASAVPATAAVPSVATSSQAFSLFDNVNEVRYPLFFFFCFLKKKNILFSEFFFSTYRALTL